MSEKIIIKESLLRNIVKDAITNCLKEGQGFNYLCSRMDKIDYSDKDELKRNIAFMKSPEYKKFYKKNFMRDGDMNSHLHRHPDNAYNYYDENGEPSQNPNDNPIRKDFIGAMGRWAALKGIKGYTHLRRFAEFLADPRWGIFPKESTNHYTDEDDE